MTLAEIRQMLLRELAVQSMAGNHDARQRGSLLLRLGRPLVLRHLQPRQHLLVYDATLQARHGYTVERVERDDVLFDRPRTAMPMTIFLDALVKGGVCDP